jgi:GNAT superfamily N-acetyltransferase
VEGVRPARPADGPRCAELVGQARAEVEGQRGGPELLAGARSPDELVTAWAAGSSASLWVGEFDGVPVGVAAGVVVPTTVRRTGRLECCYVEPAARGVGVGTALVAAVLGWFDLQACTDVDAVALPGDRAVKQLLEAAGFRARLLVLHRRLR